LGGYVNYLRLGYFGLSTLIGFSLTDLTGSFIEFAPQNTRSGHLHAYRPAQIAIFHLPIGTQWASIHDVSGDGSIGSRISKAYTRMSLYLIFRHPIFMPTLLR
jgi:hypothetical protein